MVFHIRALADWLDSPATAGVRLGADARLGMSYPNAEQKIAQVIYLQIHGWTLVDDLIDSQSLSYFD
jgi:hypothetical protein